MDIARILLKIRPNASWKVTDNDPEQIEWLDKVQVKPTLEEIETAWTSVQEEIEAEQAQKLVVETTLADRFSSLEKVKETINKLPIDEATKVFLTDLSNVVCSYIRGIN